MSRRQRPKVDVYTEGDDSYLFAVLHFPVYDKAIGRLNAGELDVFLGADYLVTLPDRRAAAGHAPVPPLLRERGAAAQPLRARVGPSLLRGARRPLRLLLPDPRQDRLQARADRRGHRRRRDSREGPRPRHPQGQAGDHLYRKIIKPQRPTLRQLERGIERFLPEELELYFDDIVDASERIWDLLDNYKEVVEALETTNESLISHQQNDILYVLTIFSVVVLPLTFLTGLFGMNVSFPGFGSATAFWAILGLVRRAHRVDARVLPAQALALADGPLVGAVAARVRAERGRDRGLRLLHAAAVTTRSSSSCIVASARSSS